MAAFDINSIPGFDATVAHAFAGATITLAAALFVPSLRGAGRMSIIKHLVN